MENFELFKHEKRRKSNHISINKAGNLYFSVPVVKKYNINNYKNVKLMYNKDNGQIAIELTNDEKDSVKISFLKNKMAYVCMIRFMKYFKIPLSKYSCEVSAIEGQENRLILDLNLERREAA